MQNYSNYENITMVVSLLKEHNIRYIVISPGGTNMPFVKAVQDDPFFTCYSIVDERSAAYFAIGIYLETGEIVAMSCTSAQATRNYIPGLTEAFYKKVPLLAISMEKHPRFKYQDYMQAPDQASLPNDCVKKSFELPFISDKNDIMHSIRVINEAILELSRDGYGPVQLCIPWLDWKLDDITPTVRCIKHYSITDSWDDVNMEGKKILIVIGEHRKFTNDETKLIDRFCDGYNSAVYVNHLSNFHGKYAVNGSLSLISMKFEKFESEFAPDILITFGGLTGDYPLYNTLSRIKLQNVEHWRISLDGKVVDTYDKLTKVFQCDFNFFMTRMENGKQTSHEYFKLWYNEACSKKTDINVPFSNVYAAEKLHEIIPENSNINFAILNSLRVWSFFDIHPSIKCFSNVGAFGIDGGISTMIGQSVVTDELCFMVVGDLSFYYDMNALGIRHIKNNVRILLINNAGGVEFKMSGINNKSIDRFIAAANHFNNAEGWATTCGFIYYSAHNKNEFNSYINMFVQKSDAPILFEIFVNDIDDADAIRKLREDNSDFGLSDKIKTRAKNTIRKALKG